MQKLTATTRRLYSFLIPYILLLILVLIAKILYSKEDIYFFINGLHFPAGDVFFPFMTEFGSSFSAVVACLLLLFVSYRSSVLMATSLILTTAINVPLKNLFFAPRPRVYFAGSQHPIYYVPHVEVLANNFSFPSGHTVCAFTMALVLTYITPRKTFGYLYLLLALLVAYSRMYMSQHFLEDVTAGSILATVVTIIWLSWFDNRPFLSDPRWNASLSRKKNAA
ncbi:phosphatase PAP2 family protein [Chitinophaga ginsengisoli]|uniref:Membrane-associated phospholipid phosphatase n=1 Tax=Chitinophaga ginsengisoli TaxID=363837 RepID=A0A2P8FNX0_9BACT|nr:phosphatase PAP2 family protein [Chitinophaga ginsengisoli]PSL23416.1 membrane-associated phospholipid phosphatase [Chitinophaga ginsengisoli]